MCSEENDDKNFMVSIAKNGNYSVINGPCLLEEAIGQARYYNDSKEKATVYDRRTGEIWFVSHHEKQWYEN